VSARLSGALALLTPLIYLLITQPTGLMWFDAGELALASATWGLGHPPGQPLYTLTGALSFELGECVGWGGLRALNALSALSLVLTLAALRDLASFELASLGSRDGDRLDWSEALLGLAWVALYPVWDQGARVELYGFATALGVWSLAWAARSARAEHEVRAPVIAGLFLGACGASNAVFAVAFGLAGLWGYLPFTRRAWGRGALGALLGFTLPHLYVLWVAYRSEGYSEGDSEAFVWGTLHTWEGITHYMSGADYRGTAHAAWSSVPEHLLRWVAWAAPLGPLLWWCFVGVSGALRVALKALTRALRGEVGVLRTLWALPLVVICGLFPLTYQNYWPAVPDFTGYLLPVLALSLLGVWRGARTLSPRVRLVISTLVCVWSLWSPSAPYGRSRASHTLPLTLARAWLNDLPQGSLLLISSDHWVFPLMYAQEVEGVRSDVVVFNVGFERSGWYWRWLRARSPQLPRVEAAGARRLESLAQAWRGPIYTERLSLAGRLTLARPPRPLTRLQPPCPASWGVSVGCEAPLPAPDAHALRALAQRQAPLSPITSRVLAAHSASLSLTHWSVGEAQAALELGYAALGRSLPALAREARWWPAPPELWAQEGVLIGDAELSLALLEALVRYAPPPHAPPESL
jgi:hypothetical protein